TVATRCSGSSRSPCHSATSEKTPDATNTAPARTASVVRRVDKVCSISTRCLRGATRFMFLRASLQRARHPHGGVGVVVERWHLLVAGGAIRAQGRSQLPAAVEHRPLVTHLAGGGVQSVEQIPPHPSPPQTGRQPHPLQLGRLRTVGEGDAADGTAPHHLSLQLDDEEGTE